MNSIVEHGEMLEKVLIGGDLSGLTPTERLNYYRAVCESLGLNPLTKPFDYLRLSGKLILYARKDATEQLRANRDVSVIKLERETVGGVYVVTAYAQTPDGRQDVSTGAVSIEGLKGDDLANALMKAETKAKRRVTLSICGLGMLDETEIETIRGAAPATEIMPEPPAALTEEPAMTLDEAAELMTPKGNKLGSLAADQLVVLIETIQAIEGRRKLTYGEARLLAGAKMVLEAIHA